MKVWLPITIRNCLRCTFAFFLLGDWWTGDKTVSGYTLPRVLLVGVDFSPGPVKGVTWTSTPSPSPSNSHFLCFYLFYFFEPMCIQLLSNTCLSVSVKNLSPNCTFLPQKNWLLTFPLHASLSVSWTFRELAQSITLKFWEERFLQGVNDLWRLQSDRICETFQVSMKTFLYLPLSS